MKQAIGVCSWSLRPETPRDLCAGLAKLGLHNCQLALDPVRLGHWELEETRSLLQAAGVRLLSGMMAMEGEDYSSLESIRRTGGVRPDRTFERNLRAARHNAEIAAELKLDLVTLHAGFMPDDGADPLRRVMVERLTAIADVFAQAGVRVAFETGQERADTLLDVLAELGREDVGVNFDPANMLLYGMDEPLEALEKLASQVFQIHIKDARRSKQSGAWGQETPVGDGEVPWNEFFRILQQREVHVALVIEREGGTDRLADIARADVFVREHLAAIGRRA